MSTIAALLGEVSAALEAPPICFGIKGEMLNDIAGEEPETVVACATVHDVVAKLTAAVEEPLVIVVAPFAPSRVIGDLNGRRSIDGALDEIVTAVFATEGEDRHVGIVMPGRYLYSRRQGGIREGFTRSMYPRLVVEGSVAALFTSAAGAATRESTAAFVLLGDGKFAEQPTRFFVIGDDVSATAAAKELRKLFSQPKGQTRHGWVYDEDLDAGQSLSAMRYAPEVTRLRRDLAAIGDVVSLREVAIQVQHTEAVDDGSSFLERSVPVLQGREISVDGRVRPLLSRVYAAPPESSRLRVGDICIRKSISPNDERLAVAEIEASQLPLASGETVIALRLDVDESLRAFVIDYLRSPWALRLLRTHEGQFTLAEQEVMDAEIPLPSPTLRSAITDLSRAEQVASQWLEDIRRIRRSVVDSWDEPPDTVLGRVLRETRLVQQRIAAAQGMDRLPVRLRQRLPYPLALGWRAFETSDHDLEGYVGILELAERTTAYLAVVAIVAAQEEGTKLKSLKRIGKELAQSGHGMTFGDWSSIIDEVQGAPFKKASGGFMVPELLTCLSPGSDGAAALGRLRRRRNEQAHGRGPKGDALEDEFDAAAADLATYLGCVEFLSEYPLRYIERTQWDSLAGRNIYTYRDLMGDHPLVAPSSASSERNDLEANSLYIVGRGSDLMLLRPLMIRERCDQCGEMTIFAFESARPGGTVTMRSLVDSHSIERPALRGALAASGVVPESPATESGAAP